MKSPQEIKPCPFCGKQPFAEYVISMINTKERFQIECICNDWVVVEDTKEKAITLWNRRVTNENQN